MITAPPCFGWSDIELARQVQSLLLVFVAFHGLVDVAVEFLEGSIEDEPHTRFQLLDLLEVFQLLEEILLDLNFGMRR